MDDQQHELIEQARMLVARLERVSVDSIWARRSSGHRGALLRWVERANLEAHLQLSPEEAEQLQRLVDLGFVYLNRAAREKK